MAENDVLTRNSNTPSDDSDHDTNSSSAVPELKGYLSKWTNYIHGWQPRFIVLKDGTLSYYKRQVHFEIICLPYSYDAHFTIIIIIIMYVSFQ